MGPGGRFIRRTVRTSKLVIWGAVCVGFFFVFYVVFMWAERKFLARIYLEVQGWRNKIRCAAARQSTSQPKQGISEEVNDRPMVWSGSKLRTGGGVARIASAKNCGVRANGHLLQKESETNERHMCLPPHDRLDLLNRVVWVERVRRTMRV